MPACVAYGCKNRPQRDRNRGITFHRFPKQDELRQKWIKAISRQNFIPSKWSSVCSIHFREEDVDRTSLSCVRLREGAVPCLFESFPASLKHPEKKPRKPPTKRPLLLDPNTFLPEQLPICKEAPCSSTDSPEKTALGRELEANVVQLKTCRKKIKLLSQSKRRLVKRNAELNHVISDLKKHSMISSDSADILEKCAGGVTDLLKRRASELQNVSLPVNYSPELRSFALTLNFYSPKAYRYVRKAFDTCLPHPKTVSKWYQKVDGRPGFTDIAFTALENKVQLAKAQGHPVLCSLIMNKMVIRKQVEWDGKQYHGYIDLGTELDDDTLPMASEALTFMAVCLNGSWRLPVGYFLIDGLSRNERKNLVQTCIEKLYEIDVVVVSLTHDGCSANISMLKSLGVTVEVVDNELKSYFTHAVTNTPIYVFMDPCHMLRLIRNTLAEKKALCIGEEIVKWEYIVSLHKLQKAESLDLGNKLRSSHILWVKKKMNVRLAAQTLSNTVASSLQFCLEEKVNGFTGCEATIRFIRIFSTLFDILNSRNLKSCGWKSPIQENNYEMYFNFLLEAKAYILSLRDSVDSKPLVAGRRKTGFVGFLLCIESLISIFKSLILSKIFDLKFLLTYKFSQDHIELFFGKIRSKGGFNNNPTARQFSRAYKQLLTHNEIQDITSGNCLPLESLTILIASSNVDKDPPAVKLINDSLSKSRVLEEEETLVDIHCPVTINYNQLSMCSEKIVTYIACFVVFKLKQSIHCEMCSKALIEDELSRQHSLIALKSKRGLLFPSNDVVDICTTCEKHFRKYVASADDARVSNSHCHKLVQSIMKCYINKPIFSSIHDSHMLDQESTSNHLILLLKTVAEKYLQVRYFYASKLYIAKLKEKIKYQSYRTLNKLILFSGQ